MTVSKPVNACGVEANQNSGPSNIVSENSGNAKSNKVLGPGLYHDNDVCPKDSVCPPEDDRIQPIPQLHTLKQKVEETSDVSNVPDVTSAPEIETAFVFDWDDTVLPSTWIQSQGLRLDEGSEVSDWQREQLSEVAEAAAETLRIAKKHGTVILITNAERGWIELSCQKFLPMLYPCIESLKVVSARTTYESPQYCSPLDWKLQAFEHELVSIFGAEALHDPRKQKNMLSLGDGMHEREALLRTTKDVPNCRTKSLKFVERPDISQICKQHSLVKSCCERIIHHDGNLDLCIRCT
jgi:hypothetical protein